MVDYTIYKFVYFAPDKEPEILFIGATIQYLGKLIIQYRSIVKKNKRPICTKKEKIYNIIAKDKENIKLIYIERIFNISRKEINNRIKNI